MGGRLIQGIDLYTGKHGIRIPQLFERVLKFPQEKNLTYSKIFKFCF